MIRRPLVICLVVWGEWHTRVFLDYALPPLMAPGNLPDVHCILWIHTTPEDAPRLARALPNAMIFCDLPNHGTPVGKHCQIWAEDTKKVASVGAPLVLLPPDMVWSVGALAAFQKRMDEGAGAIFMHAPRTTFDERFPRGIEWTNAAAARVALQREHPLGSMYRFHAANFPTHAETITWDIPGAGLLTRTLFAAPNVIDPRQFTLSRINQLAEDKPDAVHVVTDSDEVIGLSLAPPVYPYRMDMTGAPINADRVRHHLRRWSVPTSKALAQKSYRLHSGAVDPLAWASAEREAQAFVDKVFSEPFEYEALKPLPVPPAHVVAQRRQPTRLIRANGQRA